MAKINKIGIKKNNLSKHHAARVKERNILLKQIRIISEKDSDLKKTCVRAGMRNENDPLRITIYRFIAAPVLGFLFWFYTTVISGGATLDSMLLSASMGTAIGYLAPKMIVDRRAKARVAELEHFFGNMLDLLLICVEAGLSAEAAFRQVQIEVAGRSPATGDELKLLCAELSFLTDRGSAYNNLAERTQMKSYKGLAVTMVQSERYGTPLAQALRVLSSEHRTLYFQDLERRAMALPPKMTVPMMFFFMPTVFLIVLSPLIINGLNLG